MRRGNSQHILPCQLRSKTFCAGLTRFKNCRNGTKGIIHSESIFLKLINRLKHLVRPQSTTLGILKSVKLWVMKFPILKFSGSKISFFQGEETKIYEINLKKVILIEFVKFDCCRFNLLFSTHIRNMKKIIHSKRSNPKFF